LKVVFDTNVFISAFVIPGGKAEEAYLRAVKGDFALYSSVAILTEMAQKLREKFSWQEDRIAHLLRVVAKIAIIIKTQPRGQASSLPKTFPRNRYYHPFRFP
jgi:putative PIN family toxin of toxin-antitoxin system